MAMASQNLQLGKGELFFSPFAAGTQTGTGFEWLGNCPSFTLTAEVEKLDHYSSTGGIKIKDNTVLLSKNTSGTFSCDDIRPANIARYIGADVSNHADAGVTGATFAIPGASVVVGRRYQIGVTLANPTGDRQVTVTQLVNTATPATVYVAGTDYLVYPEIGMVEILAGGAIADGTGVTLTYNTAANSRTVFVTSEDDIEGELKFVSDNPVGLNIDYYMPWVKLTPNGEFALITEEWATLSFTIDVLKRGSYAALYGDGRPVLP